MIPVNLLHYLRARTAYYVAAILDSIVGDDPDPQYSRLDRMDGLGTALEVTPIYDGLVAEKLAESRAVMAPLLNTEQIAGLVEDGKADADLYDDLLDALVATPDQVWDMFDVATEADR